MHMVHKKVQAFHEGHFAIFFFPQESLNFRVSNFDICSSRVVGCETCFQDIRNTNL